MRKERGKRGKRGRGINDSHCAMIDINYIVG